MNLKFAGVALIAAGIILAGLVGMFKAREDFYINTIVDDTGTCYLADGTCLHDDRDLTLYIVGWIFSGVLVILGVFMIFFDRTQKMLAEQHIKISGALKDYAEKEDHKGKFEAFLAGFSEEEQSIIKAVHEQDGIKQSTLRYRCGMSKTTTSLILKRLEEKGVVSRKESGKTNQVFLRKKF